MLVGWGSRHFAAEAMELKVPDKVLICYFVLPTGVSILRYSNISILIKYSIFSVFIKKNSGVTSLGIDQSSSSSRESIYNR